jgi:diguanylate cyclase (GGDEF)-like protein
MPATMHQIIRKLTTVLLVCIAPFSLINFIQGEVYIGVLISIVSANLLYINIRIRRNKTYNSNIAFAVVMPIAYFILYQLVIDRGIIGILWCFPTIVMVNFIMQQRQAMVANILLIIILTPVILSQFDPSLAIRVLACLITVGGLASLFVNIINDQQKKLHQLAITDPLTGLLNRLTLQDSIKLTIDQHSRTLTPMTLVSIDIDHFKLINDKHGHDIGDQVLIQIATLLKKRCRSIDKLYRLGGEEFLFILFSTDLTNAQLFSHSIQQELAEFNFEYGLAPTLSIGLAEIDKEKTWDEYLKKADENLYRAKNSGRNTIIG